MEITKAIRKNPPHYSMSSKNQILSIVKITLMYITINSFSQTEEITDTSKSMKMVT